MIILDLPKPPSVITCAVCGAETPRRGQYHKYCESCSEVKSHERRNRWGRENHRPKEQIKASGERSKSREMTRGLAATEKNATSLVDAMTAIPNAQWHVRFSIPYSQAVSKNYIWSFGGAGKGGHVFKRRESSEYRTAITLMVKSAIRDLPVKNAKIWLQIFVQKPNHKSDAVNVLDLICDAVKDAIGVDDRWFSIAGIDWEICKVDPLIYIGISQERGAEDSQACSACGAIKPFRLFSKHKHNKHGRARICLSCAGSKLTEVI